MDQSTMQPNGLSRRRFLRTVAGGTAGLLAAGGLGALAGCGGGSGASGGSPSSRKTLTEILATLNTSRSWIDFTPPRPYDPNNNIYPNDSQMLSALSTLYAEGWRNLVTYSLDGPLSHVPALAKQAGFNIVVAGIYWYDSAQLMRERTAALAQLNFIDALVLGNEGLNDKRYTLAQLETEMTSLKADTGVPVTTTETIAQYNASAGGDHTLLALGDWVFPNIHPWYAGIRSIPNAVSWTIDKYNNMQTYTPGRTIVIKESWWPTAGDPVATEANQTLYFRSLAATNARFTWGEAFDQFWKTTEGSWGPHWGFHTDTGAPKAIVAELQSIYTASY